MPASCLVWDTITSLYQESTLSLRVGEISVMFILPTVTERSPNEGTQAFQKTVTATATAKTATAQR